MVKLRELVEDNIQDEERDNDNIVIKGAKHHNLKNISLKIPKNKLVVFTGVSGSGKSTIAFDIIHAEAQRRFMNGLSSFVRKSMEKTDKAKVDLNILIENENVSILDGAIKWFGNLREGNKTTWPIGPLDIVYDHYNVDIETPWKDLSESFKNVILYGSGDEKIEFPSAMGGKTTLKPVKGIASEIERLYFETSSEATRKKYASYMTFKTCEVCNGAKLSRDSLNVKINGKSINEVNNMAVSDAMKFMKDVYECSSEAAFKIGKDVIMEIYKRLSFLNNLGLHYLTLNRTAPTLSGGEGQRVRLATQLSSKITGVTYVLDEPCAGLHSRDTRNLINTLYKLRDNGNTVIVVEHHEDVIRSADYIVDVGPYAGVLGGEIIAKGSLGEVIDSPKSLTGKYLSDSLKVNEDKQEKNVIDKNQKFLTLKGAACNNLKNITVHFPLNRLTCVTGVSGSGKSSLISETLKPLLENLINGSNNKVGKYEEITGYEEFDKVINVSQEPIGRTPRSNPATYIGLFDKIRRVFAKTDYAKAHKMDADYFSFNSTKGRCPYCEGQGQIKVEMHFLPDVWVKCDECDGKRFKEEVLNNTIKGKSISDVLEMDVNETLEFFAEYKDIRSVLKVLKEVGLGYIKLGQSATTLSGGEAQRVKLAKELSRKTKGKTIYIFDEPTNGLHFNDIKLLINIFKKLIKDGHTLIVIEHNNDVIRSAGWIVDIGPEGGNKGGNLVAEGTVEDIRNCAESYTGRYI